MKFKIEESQSAAQQDLYALLNNLQRRTTMTLDYFIEDNNEVLLEELENIEMLAKECLRIARVAKNPQGE